MLINICFIGNKLIKISKYFNFYFIFIEFIQQVLKIIK